jgi:predicted dinucleotide-binding enzyme
MSRFKQSRRGCPCTSALAALQPQARLFLFSHYSAFQLDPTGHVAVRIDLNCIDDQDAMRQAEMLVNSFGFELREDDRMIAVFRKKKPN